MECADSAPTRKDARNRRKNYETELQIVVLQEIRWKGQGQIKKDKYNLHYSCNKRQTGQLGTEFLVKKEIVKWKSYATRPKERPRLRWENDVRNNLGRMGMKTGNRRRRRGHNGKK
jgi:hypothetical protein